MLKFPVGIILLIKNLFFFFQSHSNVILMLLWPESTFSLTKNVCTGKTTKFQCNTIGNNDIFLLKASIVNVNKVLFGWFGDFIHTNPLI